MKLGTETGSLMNHIMSQCGNATDPKIGMGCTMLSYTDRHAGTIVKMTPKSITVQEDKAIRLDKNGMSESQQYEFAADPNGRRETFRLRKNGEYVSTGGRRLLIGKRDKYHDYSF